MSSNEGHPADPDAQDKYEATVLDFLDREMAAAQPAQEAKQQSSDLDALVSDLLKQVITEADQPQDGNKLLFDSEDELFSGMTSEQQKSPFSVGEAAETALPADTSAPAETIVPTPAPPVEEPPAAESGSMRELLPEKQPSHAFPKGLLMASTLAAKGKLPVKVIACTGALAIIAGAIYFFSGKSNEAPKKAESSAAVIQLAEIKPVPASQTAPATQPDAPKTNRATAQSVPAAAVKTQAKPAQMPAPRAAAVAPVTTPVPQPVPAKALNAAVPATETGPSVQPAPAPVQVPVAASNEKSAPKPVPDNASSAAPAVPERNPDPPKPAEPLVAENSAPGPKAAAAAPAARNLVAAVPVSQASPVYPELALRTRTSASVVMELQIDEQGRVSKATPVKGPAMFHGAAVAAALKWRYRPASIGGVNVPSQATVTMVFKLNK